MLKNRIIVESVMSQRLGVRATTKKYGVSPAWVLTHEKSSSTCFVADLSNECWQNNMTHWHLEDGTGVEILTFLYDHSRLALAVRVYPTVTMANVRRFFRQTCTRYGTPASVLSDNGAIYNVTSRGGCSGFESDLIAVARLDKHSRVP